MLRVRDARCNHLSCTFVHILIYFAVPDLLMCYVAPHKSMLESINMVMHKARIVKRVCEAEMDAPSITKMLRLRKSEILLTIIYSLELTVKPRKLHARAS